MSTDNLKRHLADGVWLKLFAQREFIKAIRTGRLIAFTGSYSTEGIGYPAWEKFLLGALRKRTAKTPSNTGWENKAKRKIKKKDSESPAYFGIFEEQSENNTAMRDYIQRIFALKKPKPDFLENNVAKEISESLAIYRIITLNYDLEFEWNFFTTAQEKAREQDRKKYFNVLLDSKNDGIVRDNQERNILSRQLPDGRSAVSDVFNRSRTDRLIEFGIGSADHEAHIMHLHGRVTDRESMIVSLRDYQDQYRLSSITKLPFEHAQRMLFAGNPVIFIGIGMSEDYINSVLEQFVSDRSDRYSAPAFVIWSAEHIAGDPKSLAEAELKRLFWYHRYRVLTLFDHEIDGFENDWAGKKGTSRVRYSVELLGKLVEKGVRPFRWHEDQFRSAQQRLENWNSVSQFDIWRRRDNPDNFGEDIFNSSSKRTDAGRTTSDLPAYDILFRGTPVKAIIDHPGAGHGWMSRSIQQAFEEAAIAKRINHEGQFAVVSSVINASFICEIDSTFSLLSGLYDGKTAFYGRKNRRQALDEMTSDLNIQMTKGEPIKRHVLLVINGMDRFLDAAGRPLSNELDNMFRLAIKFHRKNRDGINKWVGGLNVYNPLTIVALGTERVRRYLEVIAPGPIADCRQKDESSKYLTILNEEIYDLDGRSQNFVDFLRGRANGHAHSSPDKTRPPANQSRYLELLQKNMASSSFGLANTTQTEAARFRKQGDWRHSFLTGCLRSSALRSVLQNEKLNPDLADLCLEIISALALFGQPVEVEVLIAVPEIQAQLRPAPEDLQEALTFLCSKQIVFEFQPFSAEFRPNGDKVRFGLHRAVMAEMRDRFGVPISDARLSCGFNLSLYASQPTDDYTPEREMQRKLGNLVDCLLKEDDSPLPDTLKRLASQYPIHKALINNASSRTAVRVRAALAIFRSYLSTSTILMQEPQRRDDDVSIKERKLDIAPLTQHANRLTLLIEKAQALATDRTEFKRFFEEHIGEIGSEPFFPDDLVWLHNELGTVKLAQGDLYEARQAFNQAEMVNRGHVEFDGRLQNWRRIQLNQLHIDIERGKISSAEARIRDLEKEIQIHATDFGNLRPDESAMDYVAMQYGAKPLPRMQSVDPLLPFDALLSAALVTGYRGFISLLAGKIEAGRAALEVACRIFSNIGEQRAYAIFQRIKSALTEGYGNNEVAISEAKLAITAAEAVHHLDIIHLAHRSLSSYSLEDNIPHSTAVLQKQLRASLEYGHDADAYRVRLEARHSLARLRLLDGDYDGALEHAADAMAMATRFGFSLRKITLRILIGEILIKRGDIVSGSELVKQALKNADRIGYQRAVGRAQSVLLDSKL